MNRPVYPLFPKSAMLLGGVIALLSCSTNPSQPDSTAATEVVSTHTMPPEKTVEDFLLWLEKHPEQSDERNCFELDGVDATGIDEACLQQHMNGLAKTGLFSTFYLDQLREEYKVMSSDIQKDGYAATKDYDRYFNSQDPPTFAATLEILRKTKSAINTPNKASVSLSFDPTYSLVYELIKEDDRWKIQSIK